MIAIKIVKRLIIALVAVQLLLLLGLSVFYVVRYLPSLASLLGDFGRFREYILGFGRWSILAYLFFQIIQVLIPAIPSEAVQSAGGYVFGTFWGIILSTMGTLLGGMAAFFAARLLGKSWVRKVVSEKAISRLENLFEHPRYKTAILIIYLIPGMPKDVLNYVAGLSPADPGSFLFLSTIARLPAAIIVIYMGATLHEKNYTEGFALILLLVLLFILGVLFRSKLIALLQKSDS